MNQVLKTRGVRGCVYGAASIFRIFLGADAAELGDVLFVLTGLAAWYGASAEDALRGTNAKVEARFRYVEERVRERGVAIKDLPLDELLALWHQAKSLDAQPA